MGGQRHLGSDGDRADHAITGCNGAAPHDTLVVRSITGEERLMTQVVRRQSSEPMTRWDPASDLQSLSTLMSRFLEGFGDAPPVLDGGFVPAADIEETDNAFIIEVELPGISKKDVDVSISGRRLTISGERKERERTGVLRRRVRSMGSFRYEVVLPADVNEDSVDARLHDGVLTVQVAKRAADNHHVEIQ
jgi:HSP20 family protein